MTRPAVQLGHIRADLGHQNAAVDQACVPTVSLKGDSYRLRGKDLDARIGAKHAEIA
jgi:hypothetical protein